MVTIIIRTAGMLFAALKVLSVATAADVQSSAEISAPMKFYVVLECDLRAEFNSYSV
jgi:hypothetical protein